MLTIGLLVPATRRRALYFAPCLDTPMASWPLMSRLMAHWSELPVCMFAYVHVCMYVCMYVCIFTYRKQCILHMYKSWV